MSHFAAICVLTTMYYSVLAFGNVNILDRAAWKDIHGFIRVFGICMYGTSGICVALPVENNMRSPKHFPIVVQFGKYSTCIRPVVHHNGGERSEVEMFKIRPITEETSNVMQNLTNKVIFSSTVLLFLPDLADLRAWRLTIILREYSIEM